MTPHGRRVPVAEGVSLHVLSSGEESAGGLPFLLVHGLASNARLWDGVRAELAARGHRVVAVDLRGHGRSDKPDEGYDVATVARDVDVLMEALGLSQAVVAGQSWGGNVVLELASVVAPSRVAAAVLIDGGWIDLSHFPTWEDVSSAMAPPRLLGRPFAEMEAWARRAHPDWPEPGLRGALACYEVREDGTIAPWLTYERHMKVLRGLWEHRPSARYPLVSAPVVLLACEAGGSAPSDDEFSARKRVQVEAAAAGLPSAVVRWVRADHDVHAQHPSLVAEVLVEAAAMASPSSSPSPSP